MGRSVRAVVEQMRSDDREFITAETVAEFAGCSQVEAAVVGKMGFTPEQIGLKVKGLRASIYKHKGGSSANGGISQVRDEVTIVGLQDNGATKPVPRTAQVFEPTADAPAVVLVAKSYSFGGPFVHAEPATGGGGVGPMMGGAFVSTSDSRFGELIAELTGTGKLAPGAVPLHDRFETTEQYATYD